VIGLPTTILYNLVHSYYIRGEVPELPSKLDKLRDKKEVWLNIMLLKKLVMLKHQTTLTKGYNLWDSNATLKVLLPFESIPKSL